MKMQTYDIKRTFATFDIQIANMPHIPDHGYDGAKPRPEDLENMMTNE